MKKLCSLLIVVGSLASQANADTTSSIILETLDAKLTFGGNTVSGDGTAVTAQVSTVLDNGIGFLGSYSNAKGKVGAATWELQSTSVGVGYELSNTIDKEAGSGISVLAGLGYTSTSGEVSGGGTTASADNDFTAFVGQVTGRVNNTMSFTAGVIADIEGDTDPTFSIAVGYDLTDTGKLTVGYSTNNTTSSGVTAEISGWAIGWTSTF